MPLDYIKKNAAAIIKASPVPYVRDSEVKGSLFDPNDPAGLVCGVDSGFPIDHTEVLEALESVRPWGWPLGDLPDGYEFLLLFPVGYTRSRSSSAPRASSQ